MTSEEIKALTDAVTAGGDALTTYVAGLKPSEGNPINLDGVKKFLDESDDGKRYLQAYGDKRVNDGITTAIEKFKKEKMPSLLDEEIKKRFPEADPKDKAIAELKAEMEAMKASNLKKDLTNKALKTLTENKLPSQLADFIVGNDEETTNKNLETLTNIFNQYGESVKTDFAKSGAYNPPKGNPKPTDEEAKAINDAKSIMEKAMGIKL
ncbi:DUF4355 domain-containing protein [Clostridium sp.]|uniref:DUF4355 domain-containing protein n=1 Tax=Clostridium sp. TaxID=1506 RepID=UPI0026036E47|nr:DUF4355 domain-containing protein [Clostridium sp.]